MSAELRESSLSLELALFLRSLGVLDLFSSTIPLVGEADKRFLPPLLGVGDFSPAAGCARKMNAVNKRLFFLNFNSRLL